MAFNEANLYVGSFGTKPENVEVPKISDRPPTSLDTNYPIGKRWVDRILRTEYTLTDLTSPNGVMTAFWTILGEGDATLATISGDIGTPPIPLIDNVNIVGQSDGAIKLIDTIVSGNTLTIQDNTTTTSYVVSPSSTDGEAGTFPDLQSAINAAPVGTTVFLKDGTYTGNYTLKAGVNLCCYGFAGFTPTCTIKGTLTFTGAVAGQNQAVTITGIRLITNGSYSIAVTGTNPAKLYLVSCYLNANDFTHTLMTSSASTSSIRIIDSWANTNTNAYGFFDISGAGSLTIFGVNVFDTVPTSVQSTFSSSGMLLVRFSVIRFPITTSGTGRLSATDSEFNTFITNITALTIGSTPSGDGSYLRTCTILSGSATAMIVNSTININLCGIYSTNSLVGPISGSGTLIQVGTAYMYNTVVTAATTLTMTRKSFDPGLLYGNWSGVAPAAGYVGESISSVVAPNGVTIPSGGDGTNITSIVLTPGTWDVSAIGMFTGITTMTRQTVSISTTSAFIDVTTYGNSTISGTFITTTAEDVGFSIPSYRQLVLKGTTVTLYLVTRASFSVSTAPKSYGKISANRVC